MMTTTDGQEQQHHTTSLTSLLASIFAHIAAPPPAHQPHLAPTTTSTSHSSSSSSSSSSSRQDPALALLALIERCNTLCNSLGLFSDNDSLEDLPTSTLRALFIHSAWAEVESNLRTLGDLQARKKGLQSSRAHYITFVRTLFDLNILPKTGSASAATSPFHLLASLLRSLSANQTPSSSVTASIPSNPHQRRELKVALFKLERAFKAALDEFRHSARAKASLSQGGGLRIPATGTSTGLPSSSAPLDEPDEAQWDLLVLPRRNGRGEGNDDDDEDEEDADASAFVSGTGRSAGSSQQRQQQRDGTVQGTVSVSPPTNLRAYLLMLLQLHALLAFNNLAAIEDEIELLGNIPASAARDARESQAREEAEMERRRRGSDSDELRLERRFDASTPGPLMDDKGKPLRPFTITASNIKSKGLSITNGQLVGGTPVHDLDERQRIREGVFKPGHRLPTMSIDEYLEEEQRRGNIIQGGGAAGAAQPTPRESRALRMENDGTVEAQEAEQEARREALEWDEFKESNKRGAGNTMNRG